MKSILIALFALLGMLLIVVTSSLFSDDKQTVSLGNQVISVETASTSAEQKKGLSGRDTLPEGNGMLFLFREEDRVGFWMKDMKFPLDIVWINRDKKIVDIALEVPLPTSEAPATYYPSTPAQYVLELPAGYTKKYNVKVGDTVIFQLRK